MLFLATWLFLASGKFVTLKPCEDRTFEDYGFVFYVSQANPSLVCFVFFLLHFFNFFLASIVCCCIVCMVLHLFGLGSFFCSLVLPLDGLFFGSV